MSNFNFYINVDQCLNMSNFDMFFYKLQSEHKFHLSNVQFFDDEGNRSLKKAFYDIRNYIDKSAFRVRDYRLIFGMRANRKRAEETGWYDTILYRLLKIYFELSDAKIFIKSKDSVDKSVSVIMLYDAEFTYEENDIDGENYDLTPDIAVLMKCLGIDWKSGIKENELVDTLSKIIRVCEESNALDMVTKRFLKMFIAWYDPIQTSENMNDEIQHGIDWGERESWEQEFIDNALEEEMAGKRNTQITISNQLGNLLTFTRECIGHYCVFRKEINKNSMAENLLSLLSIVDYITSDFEPEEGQSKIKSIETLRMQSRSNWKKATNDTGIQKRYGLMMNGYKSRLKTEFATLEQKIKYVKAGDEAPEYQAPEKIAGTKGILSKSKEEYMSVFHEILEEFMKKSIKKNKAEMSWKKAYQELKEKLNMMEEELQIFARDISKSYKRQLEERKEHQKNNKTDIQYSQESLSEELENNARSKEKLLSLLRKPQMNPLLTFQDQLNMENALDQCNLEISFYIKCYNMIKVWNFMLLLFSGGGLYFLHYILMQSYSFSDSQMMMAMFVYIAVSFVLMLLCWNAPYFYFRRKIRKTLDYLKEQMEIYIMGYFDKAENFTLYINAINELDALGVHMSILEKSKKKCDEKVKKYLWHKVQIREHLRKSGYFDNMISILSSTDITKCTVEDCELNVDEGVIANNLYWPQYSCKFQEVER